MDSISIVLPCLNEAENLKNLLPKLKAVCQDAEILVVNDGSTDETLMVCQAHSIRVISHPYRMGNGAAIKTGARHADGDIIVFMDSDGQHNPDDIAIMLAKLAEGYDMVIGARKAYTHASWVRRIGNAFYNWLASSMTGHKIEDLTSGFRVVRACYFRRFLYLLPNGFSYPTTSTMAFFRSGLTVAYVPIHAGQRGGKSKIKMLRDGARFFIIILKVGALFSPMRLFLPVSTCLFLSGIGLYAYTYMTMGRFTNMSALMFTSALLTFLIGILSEQISSLHYKSVAEDHLD